MIWVGLVSMVIILLTIDLLVLNRNGQVVNNKKAAIETICWIVVAFLFSGVVYWLYDEGLVENVNQLSPQDAWVKYITGYLIELSLSVDNLFVIAIIFTSFKIPLKYQHKALFWGILGAIVFRGAMIIVGIALITKISWMSYVFGAFLLFTAFRMLGKEDEDEQVTYPAWLMRYFPISDLMYEDKFRIIDNGIKKWTPLFAALVMIELTDLLFALDSIPAIFAVTTDPFIVFSSNIFAILGLRAMYFFLAKMLRKFHYLKYSVFAILLFIGLKLLALDFVEFPEWFSLAFIGISLLMGVLTSWLKFDKP